MSVEQKHNVMKSVDGQERGTLDVIPPEEEKAKSSSSSCSEEEETSSTESETGKCQIGIYAFIIEKVLISCLKFYSYNVNQTILPDYNTV
jgi:hypothetical protein